eukprot:TRINITY_DN106481_c0_g1_i1.p1 TRINITY_DN106481_c0_g1~~TRINITY_DN106481_c0_g1_i1.p1  ORF type:complete len:629 (-),score=120.54 TRINITY_DN106481_c0_g1_i1:124-2010(-)
MGLKTFPRTEEDLVGQYHGLPSRIVEDNRQDAMQSHAVEKEDQLLEAILASNGNLRKALQMLLEVGGDERSQTDPKTGLTKYHTPSEPVNGILRSSCTSNVPDQVAFSRGVDLLRQLSLEARNMSKQLRPANPDLRSKACDFITPEGLFRKLLLDVRERLRAVLELDFSDIINLFPSGTDAELLPALLAYVRAEGRGHGMQVLSLICAAGEVGSGTTSAATGQHFAKQLPSGRQCPGSSSVFGELSLDSKAEPTDGNAFGNISSQSLSLRDASGCLLSLDECDAIVEEAVESALEKTWPDGKRVYGQVVVHMVVGSKTGRSMPSEQCLQRIIARHGAKVILPVVDACQGRLAAGVVRSYLDQNWLVLTTGSKFMGGPPFSGVCLMSQALGQELEKHLQIESVASMIAKSKLHEYVTASLLSDDLPRLRSLLPCHTLNYGVLMRWTLALHTMEVYFADCLPEERSQILVAWASHVRKILQCDRNPRLQLLNDSVEHTTGSAIDEQQAALDSIVSFHCRCNRGTGGADKLTIDELRFVQYLMASDLSKQYPQLDVPEVAKLRCFLGQPVDLRPGGGDREHVLRVAASAPLVTRIAAEGLDSAVKDDAQLFEKLSWVLEHWYLLSPSQSAL